MFFARHRSFGIRHVIGLAGLLALSGAVVYYVMSHGKSTRVAVRKVERTATRVVRKARNAAKPNHTPVHT